MDFGVAKVLAGEDRDLTGSGMAVGTPQYMSPEQACGDPGADHRSDLYALGAVAYQLLTGRPVFERDTPAEVMRAHISTPPPDLASHRHVPAALAAVVMRCLAKRPEERFSSAADLVAALEGGPGSEPPARGDIARGRVVAATVLAFLLAAALVWWRAGRETSPQAVQSVAVLYFDNLSRDSSDLYLAEGLTEEIATRLGGVGRLLVKSRNAVRRAQAEMAGDVAALGRALAVRYLVEGSVRRAGPRVRVTVSLVTTADGFRVWSAEFDRATMDLLTLQEEIAREVAVMIAGRLLPQERATLARRPTADAMAYDHFLRANHHLSRRGPQALAQAIHEYREAVRRDSGFTQAQAREALAYAIALWWGWRPDGAPAESLLARGLAATDRILARDSAVADAWTARGFLLTFRHPRSYEGVEEAFRSAFALEPDNIEGLQQYAWVKSTTGDDSAAAAAYRRILALEPSRAITYSALAWHVPNLGSRHAEALRLLDSAVAIDPSAFFLYPLRATVRLELGDTAGARQDAETAVRLSPADYTMMAEAVRAEVSARTGEPQADRLLRDLLRRLPEPAAPSPLDASFVGSALVAAGRHEQALALLERVRPQGAALWFFLRFPGFGPLRGNPRFEALLAASRPPTIRE
jgi:serine/threonine-protein kinase